MSPRERFWPGRSTGFERETRDAQSGRGFKNWSAQYERRNNGSSPTSQGLPRANPKAYYRTSDGTLVKGVELAEGILPANLQRTTPSFRERLKKEWKLLYSLLFSAKIFPE